MGNQRTYDKPTILVVNEGSQSDAENFTEGYRRLGLGKVVGVPTAGSVIYTRNIKAVDGSIARIPFMRVDDIDGNSLERAPRSVDVLVRQPLGTEAEVTDPQLAAAVRELVE